MLGIGVGFVNGAVLVDSGVLAAVGVFVVPIVLGLEMGVVFAGPEVGLVF